MDVKMASSTDTTSSTFSTWDFDIKNGIASFITGDDADVQLATIAAFLQIGSIPQLPSVGVPWVEFLTHQVTFGDLDAALRSSAQNAGVTNFQPNYYIEDQNLVVRMKATYTEV